MGVAYQDVFLNAPHTEQPGFLTQTNGNMVELTPSTAVQSITLRPCRVVSGVSRGGIVAGFCGSTSSTSLSIPVTESAVTFSVAAENAAGKLSGLRAPIILTASKGGK